VRNWFQNFAFNCNLYRYVVAGTHFGRVKRLVGSGGLSVDAVGPSEPFELTGLRGVPGAGDQLMVGLGCTAAECS
jgi:hypothetical protein